MEISTIEINILEGIALHEYTEKLQRINVLLFVEIVDNLKTNAKFKNKLSIMLCTNRKY